MNNKSHDSSLDAKRKCYFVHDLKNHHPSVAVNNIQMPMQLKVQSNFYLPSQYDLYGRYSQINNLFNLSYNIVRCGQFYTI